ncbi:hypothetical protein GGX14DRAFT_553432 [Mycena pura]|uniref:Uncharacterized protein n=1 Tax=Mycena pura TaxID=153505 RepID=A0AAD6YV52_9AGAR|nr:hypothetical protein GGX14DRAFT_553432 [Mycena pura]
MSHHRPSSNPATDDPPSNSEEDGVNYKAKYLALQAQHRMQQKRKAGPRAAVSTQAMGRGIRMLAALFGEISSIVADAEAYLVDRYPEDDYDEFTPNLTLEQEKYLAEKRGLERNLAAYEQLTRLVPNLEYKLAHTTEPADLVDFYTQLQKGANDSRSDDLGRITRLLCTTINADRDRPDIAQFDHSLPIITQDGDAVRQYAPALTEDRLNRGVQHDICGGLLSSSVVLAKYEYDTPNGVSMRNAARTNLSNAFSETFFCRVFYEGFRIDDSNIHQGFLKSRYLVKNWKAVFTGPASAKGDEENDEFPAKKIKTNKAIRKPVSETLRMNGKATGRSIAYICGLTHFGLTNATQWIDEYYGTPQRAHVDDLLAWWNQRVFPNHSSTTSTNQTTIASMAKMKAQLRA